MLKDFGRIKKLLLTLLCSKTDDFLSLFVDFLEQWQAVS